MIATFLQDDLAADLAETFKNFRLKDPQGEAVRLNIFKQSLPIPTAKDIPETVTDEELEEGVYDAEAEEDPYPYIIVRVEQGKIENIDQEQTVVVNLIIGVIDRDFNNQGHKDVLNIIQKIYERFAKNAILAQKYECVMPIEWALQDEESFPYFFGGMALNFETIPIRREDPYT